MLGKFTLSAIPFDQPIPRVSAAVVIPAAELGRFDRANIEVRHGIVIIAGGA
jgi:hypothetical protein